MTKKMEGSLLLLFVAIIVSSHSCKNYKLGENANMASTPNITADSTYQYSTYIKKDSSGMIQIIGQLLNGKKDGAWRFYNKGKVIRVEHYEQDIRILTTIPEMINSFQTYQIYLPNAERKIFSFRKKKLDNIETRSNNNVLKEEFEYDKNNDTIIIKNSVNDSVFYNVLTNNKHSFYKMAFHVNDSSVLLIDLSTGKFYIK